jgi:hypothetical protein
LACCPYTDSSYPMHFLSELRDPHTLASHPSNSRLTATPQNLTGNGALLLLARRQPGSLPLLPIPPPPQPPLPSVPPHRPSPARPAVAALAPLLRRLLAPAASATRGRGAHRLRLRGTEFDRYGRNLF